VSLHLLLKLLGSSYAIALERQRVERDFEALRERQALALIAANDGMWDYDTQSGKTYFSPRWKKMLGYSEDDFEDSKPDWRLLVHGEDYTQVQARSAITSMARPRSSRACIALRAQERRVALGDEPGERPCRTQRAS
jgi:PAS domain-containing protein